MGSNGTRARRRLLAAGVAAGLAAGAALGASLLTGAAPARGGPTPLVLHAAPALVTAAHAVDLAAATYCEQPDAPSCAIADAVLFIRAAGVSGWAEIPATREVGVLRFHVPADLVPADGFSYWLRLRARDGSEVDYPPGGASSPIRVVTTAGLPEVAMPALRWRDRERPAATALRLPPGQGRGQVGFSGDGGLDGPSSFDVAPDGSIVVADWANGRIERFGPDGRYVDEAPLPVRRPVDLAIAGADRLFMTTLGTDAQAFEMAADGKVLGRYPVGYGVASRVAAGPVPRVRVGTSQWIPVREALGVPLGADAQGRAETTSVPLPDGSVGLTADLPGGFAAVWTRPDGSRAGAVVRLPKGVFAGADYFARPLPDGGALVARGVWDETHFGVALLRLTAAGRIASFSLLPEPSHLIVAPYSTIRFLGPRAVLMATDDGEALQIQRFGVR
ncbi:MAG: SMP-30/gluconolactonase/LRE family protein [Actinomycetota bacterium]